MYANPQTSRPYLSHMASISPGFGGDARPDHPLKYRLPSSIVRFHQATDVESPEEEERVLVHCVYRVFNCGSLGSITRCGAVLSECGFTEFLPPLGNGVLTHLYPGMTSLLNLYYASHLEELLVDYPAPSGMLYATEKTIRMPPSLVKL